jgi:hypothetical protein
MEGCHFSRGDSFTCESGAAAALCHRSPKWPPGAFPTTNLRPLSESGAARRFPPRSKTSVSGGGQPPLTHEFKPGQTAGPVRSTLWLGGAIMAS